MMRLVYLFSLFLIAGMFVSQLFDLGHYRPQLLLVTDVCLAYIMIEVGLEFLIDKKHWQRYIWDYIVAALAAALPWAFCFLYFIAFFDNTWEETLFIARFAAPTSSGILFSMLAAAGLATTWLFRKIQVLAILDNLDTILLLIPLQFLLLGTRYQLLAVVAVIIVLIALAWKFLHKLRLPIGRPWLFGYSVVLALFMRWLLSTYSVEIEILLPAFVLGCLLYNPHDPRKKKEHTHEHAYIEPEEHPSLVFDRTVKIVFMFCVGLILPRVPVQGHSIWMTLTHVLLITVLSNIGKCFPMLCYRKQAPFRERAAISVGMFPRGEVGAGILVLAIEHGAGGYAASVAALSLALNLLLTGLFIWIVIRLVRKRV